MQYLLYYLCIAGFSYNRILLYVFLCSIQHFIAWIQAKTKYICCSYKSNDKSIHETKRELNIGHLENVKNAFSLCIRNIFVSWRIEGCVSANVKVPFLLQWVILGDVLPEFALKGCFSHVRQASRRQHLRGGGRLDRQRRRPPHPSRAAGTFRKRKDGTEFGSTGYFPNYILFLSPLKSKAKAWIGWLALKSL